MDRLITLRHIQKSLNSVKELIGQVLSTTVDALSELKSKIPTKVSELENDVGFLTESPANITYELSSEGKNIVLNGSDGSKSSVTNNSVCFVYSDNEPENQYIGDIWMKEYE